MTSQYKSCHKYFLQAMMNRGIVSQLECKNICQKFCDIANEQFSGTLQAFLDIVNAQIRPFHFEIKSSKREDTGESVYILVSLVENDLNRLIVGGDFSRQEIDFFKKMIELIILSDSLADICRASSTDILNLADTISPKLSKIDAKKLLDRFVTEQWFYDNNGMITMSPRSILELEEFFLKSFEDFIKTCKMCDRTVFHGQGCRNCDARLHNFCAARYFLNTDKCMNCGQPWPSIYQNLSVDELPMNIGDNSEPEPVNKRRKKAKVH